MALDFKGRVAIVTGAGGGLGRQHALALAGARRQGGGQRPGRRGRRLGRFGGAAQAVVDEIRAAGGEAIANGASVTDFEAVQAMVQQAVEAWGRVDILVNNAGILRDKSFAKMDLADFRLVLDVHLMGAVHCSKAVWPLMTQQKYGRIVMTTSSSGLYGNFGQSNYGAAKMALVGLMQTLAIEGAKNDIRVNCLAPTAATRMTEDLFPPDMLEALRARRPWCRRCWCWRREDAPTRTILCAGAGGFEAAHVTLTQGAWIGTGADAPERLQARLDAVRDRARRDRAGQRRGAGRQRDAAGPAGTLIGQRPLAALSLTGSAGWRSGRWPAPPARTRPPTCIHWWPCGGAYRPGCACQSFT